MKLYHSTSLQAARKIAITGFRDAPFMSIATGVCLCDRPLNHGDAVAFSAEACFIVTAPESIDLDQFEIIEDNRPPEAYREWLVPASVVNTWPRDRFFDGVHFE